MHHVEPSGDALGFALTPERQVLLVTASRQTLTMTCLLCKCRVMCVNIATEMLPTGASRYHSG
jgi:hypothetical protein